MNILDIILAIVLAFGGLIALEDGIYDAVVALEAAVGDYTAAKISDSEELARGLCDRVIPLMDSLRELVDEAEKLMPASDWPFPSYGDIMFKI